MKNVLPQAVRRLNKNRKYRKFWQRAVRVMGTVVVFCTTYALILPAITMEAKPACGFEAHEHTESCYIQQQVTEFTCKVDGQGVTVHAHSDLCFDADGALICPLPEVALHTHTESCVSAERVLTCQQEEAAAHSHGVECYSEPQLVCTQSGEEGHVHEVGCYAAREIVCGLSETEGHAHDDACYTEESKLTCGREEVVLHVHDEACYNADNSLVCTIPLASEHVHTENCLTVTDETVLSCQMPEHTHTDTCYPIEDSEVASEFACGSGEHSHVETCYDESGALICSIPEHTHTDICTVKELDQNADVETAAQWEQTLADVTLTGVWSDDLLAVAQSQLGYTESVRNVVQEDGSLRGYTRYGAKYDMPYGDWDAMFVMFCLEYAEITDQYMPYEMDSAAWIEILTEKGLYVEAGDYTPAAGDLVFVDTDQDEEADHVGILSEMDEDGKLQIISGDTANNDVAYETVDEGIIGYGKLPQNPLTQEQWNAANQVKALIAALPAEEDVADAFQSLNEQGDKEGYEALRQEVISRLDTICQQYDAFNELQKARVGSLERLDELKTLCGGKTWEQYPALTGDNAAVSGLTSNLEENPDGDDAVRNGETIEYSFTVDTTSYYTDISYGEALVKVELVLPFTAEQAAFDLSAMTWLENAELTAEVRAINGADTQCQVLTGYKRLTADGENAVVVPGSFTETVAVQALDLAHGEHVAVIISAAMKQGAWNGLCETHQIAEKLTVVTEARTVFAPLSAEAQQVNYEAYLETIGTLMESSEEIEPLWDRIVEAYVAGELNVEQYGELNQLLMELSGVDLNSIAEPSDGNGWRFMDFGDPNFSIDENTLSASARNSAVPMYTAMSAAAYSRAGLTSNSQIPSNGWGGGANGEKVYVSKTIEGTAQENVFDITLQIITQDQVTQIYEADMAVVIVMDISNTMTSIFSGETTVTRFNAAMDSAEAFLKKFAENNSSGLGKVGYVAFNTHAHKVFDMTECSDQDQAATLANKMRVECGNIMGEEDEYDVSHDRFTNMQAGLKMAEDMLAEAGNKHKYVIFLSDGFPTTYLKTGSSSQGYDPYVSSGTTTANGVFYDSVLGVYCKYGTSYSDTAAIKAREQAVAMKNDGINIFSIGVDVAGQTIKRYHDNSVPTAAGSDRFSTVERRQNATYYITYGYEIGTKHDDMVNGTGNSTGDFENWLKGTATSGIGSGYYYSSTDEEQLLDAYTKIFDTIKELNMNAESSHLDWVATDPMPDMDVHELKAMEFIGFWDLYGNLQGSSVTRSQTENYPNDNTATFDTATSTIKWDLKKSGYAEMGADDNKQYQMYLRYRVRLQNENNGFNEKQIYDTNDTTYLDYRIIEVVDNVTQVSGKKQVEFPIPKVFGYLAELNFKKVDPVGNPVSGAKFTLTHDTDSCGACRGDGVNSVDLPVYNATSGMDGMVTFTNIPSGHHYTMVETEAPNGYINANNKYSVEVSYNSVTVTALDSGGAPYTWTTTKWNEETQTSEEVTAMSFRKSGAAEGTEFTLTHDIKNCSKCTEELPVYTAKAEADGFVTFTEIASGHRYILSDGTSTLEVYYDTETLEIYNSMDTAVSDTAGLGWSFYLENDTYYELPNTGGTGTHNYTFGGLLILAAALMYGYNQRRKRERGASQ